MINQTEPYLMLQRVRLLSEAVAWLDTFRTSPNLRRMILDMIRDDQLKAEGVDANDEVIGFYSWTTSRINPKKRFNTPYTLDDTGSFYKSMFVQVLVDRLIIDANSGTFTEMQEQEWWRDDILGLTDENLQKLIEEVKQSYIDYARRILFKGR